MTKRLFGFPAALVGRALSPTEQPLRSCASALLGNRPALPPGLKLFLKPEAGCWVEAHTSHLGHTHRRRCRRRRPRRRRACPRTPLMPHPAPTPLPPHPSLAFLCCRYLAGAAEAEAGNGGGAAAAALAEAERAAAWNFDDAFLAAAAGAMAAAHADQQAAWRREGGGGGSEQCADRKEVRRCAGLGPRTAP